MGDMQELLKALADASDDATADKIAELLETAEAARETKQTERANDYCSQAIDLASVLSPDGFLFSTVDLHI